MTASAAPASIDGRSSGRRGPRPAWLGLLVQPVAVLAVFAAFVVWLTTADLTTAERTTLNPSDLLAYTGEHLALTFVSAAIVLLKELRQAPPSPLADELSAFDDLAARRERSGPTTPLESSGERSTRDE